MADFLTIAGTIIQVVEFREVDPIVLSPKTRAWAGQLRGVVRGTVRHWSGLALEMPQADYESLRTSTVGEKEVSVGGAAMPGGTARTCVVKLGGPEYIHNGNTFLVSVPFVIESVNPE